MKKYLFELGLGAALGAAFLAVSKWQSAGRLSQADVDHYIRILEANLPPEWEDRAEFISRMRAWGESDDGKPVYMLNLMRFFDELKDFPGGPTTGTPEEANAIYEKSATPLLLKNGGYPMIAGAAKGVRPGKNPQSNLLVYKPENDSWDRVLVVRYPGRRSFFEVVSNPEYLKVMPYKLASLEVILTPVTGEMIIPDLRWVVGGLSAVIFLAAGWIRAPNGKCCD